MNKVLYIILISLFSFTVFSCAKKSSTSSDASDDLTAPVLAEVTPVPNQISNSVPEYTFSSTMNGNISYPQPESSVAPQDDYEGNWSPITCWAGREEDSEATIGDNTIKLYSRSIRWMDEELGVYKQMTLYDGTYSNYCKITVLTWNGYPGTGDGSIIPYSNILTVSPFTIGSGVFVAVGDNGNIVRSTDNGTTWDNATSPTA
ncbi:uncharacterized protein METZ01_LOCUS400325, partial [marine metagenome]